MFLTVIIPTRNRAPLLEKAIRSLENQTYPRTAFEVIVVDNGSTDATKEICLGKRRQIDNFKYLYAKRPGLHVGRHAGWHAAKGEITVFIDDDIQASTTWLEGLAEAFQDQRVGLVGGKILPDFEEKPPEWVHALWRKTSWGVALPYYSLLDFGDTELEISPFHVWGCNFAIRKELLQEVGGFHPDGMPEDLIRFRGDGETAVTVAVRNKGYGIRYHPKASVHHFVPASRMSADYLYRRAFAEGITASYTTTRLSGGISFSLRLRNMRRRVAYPVQFFLDALTGRHLRTRNTLRRGHWEGYWYHQREMHKDSSLVEWVLRKDYLSEDGD